MKFKLLKDLPDVKAGAVGEYDPENGWIEFYIEKDKICYPVNPELYPDWFAPYIFTNEFKYLSTNTKPFVMKDLSPIENLKSYPFKGVNENEFKYISTKENAQKYMDSLKIVWKIHQVKENNFFIWTKNENSTFEHQENKDVFYSQLETIRGVDMMDNLKKEDWKIYSIKNQNGIILKIGDYIKRKETNVIEKIIKIDRTSVTLDSLKTVSFEDIGNLKPEFKVGDIVYCSVLNAIVKITEISENYIYWSNGNLNGNYIRLATNDEIIKYYEHQGWIKGAKFKDTLGNIYTINSLFINDNNLFFRDKERNIYCIRECELIKEPNYPKSWRDLEIKGDVNGFSINVNEVVDYDTFYTQITDFHITENGLHCFSKKSQARSALAFAQLTQLHKATIDEYNRVNRVNWYPDWNDYTKGKWTVVRSENKLKVNSYINTYANLTFPNKELAEFALVNWKNLWEEYYELNN